MHLKATSGDSVQSGLYLAHTTNSSEHFSWQLTPHWLLPKEEFHILWGNPWPDSFSIIFFLYVAEEKTLVLEVVFLTHNTPLWI